MGKGSKEGWEGASRNDVSSSENRRISGQSTYSKVESTGNSKDKNG